MVQNLSSIVEHRSSRSLPYNLFQRQALIPTARKQFVEIIHISLQMLAMMERQRLRTNHRLQRLRRIRKHYQIELSHNF